MKKKKCIAFSHSNIVSHREKGLLAMCILSKILGKIVKRYAYDKTRNFEIHMGFFIIYFSVGSSEL